MKDEVEQTPSEEKLHPLQRLFDRPFVLLIAGMLVMAVFYTLWGIVEIMTMGKAPLP